jgi:hypothetical protein
MKHFVLSDAKPTGYSVLRAFLEEMKSRKIAETKTTTALAEAFEQILKGADAAKALRLTRGRGERTQPTLVEFMARYSAWFEFIEAELDADPRRGAMERAIDKACNRFKKSRSAVLRAWKYNAPFYRLRKNLAFIEQYVSGAEFAELGNGPMRVLLKLARERKRESVASK